MPSTWAYSHIAVYAWHTMTSPEVPPCDNYGMALWEIDWRNRENRYKTFRPKEKLKVPIPLLQNKMVSATQTQP